MTYGDMDYKHIWTELKCILGGYHVMCMVELESRHKGALIIT